MLAESTQANTIAKSRLSEDRVLPDKERTRRRIIMPYREVSSSAQSFLQRYKGLRPVPPQMILHFAEACVKLRRCLRLRVLSESTRNSAHLAIYVDIFNSLVTNAAESDDPRLRNHASIEF